VHSFGLEDLHEDSALAVVTIRDEDRRPVLGGHTHGVVGVAAIAQPRRAPRPAAGRVLHVQWLPRA